MCVDFMWALMGMSLLHRLEDTANLEEEPASFDIVGDDFPVDGFSNAFRVLQNKRNKVRTVSTYAGVRL